MYKSRNKIAFASVQKYRLSLMYCVCCLLLRERERLNGRISPVIAPAERTFKDRLCNLETCSILRSLLVRSLLMISNVTIYQYDYIGIIALCSFVDGGTVWRLAERVVQPYLPSKGRQEESASKIKLLKLFLQPGLLGLLKELLFTVPCLLL